MNVLLKWCMCTLVVDLANGIIVTNTILVTTVIMIIIFPWFLFLFLFFRIRMVCSNRVAEKHPARGHSHNEPLVFGFWFVMTPHGSPPPSISNLYQCCGPYAWAWTEGRKVPFWQKSFRALLIYPSRPPKAFVGGGVNQEDSERFPPPKWHFSTLSPPCKYGGDSPE